MMIIDIIILTVLVFSALWAVMTRSLLRSAIGLALTSVVLTIMMFRLNAPLAAVFELSVCAGLISVVFVSAISVTEPLTRQEVLEHMRQRLSRFWLLPVILIVTGAVFVILKVRIKLGGIYPQAEADVRNVLWNLRQLDILGQVIILLAGIFGVVILFREAGKK